MENNSDKELRDKLKSVEAPFDPQAWESMEAMLDRKKKRRGFFWWWTGGIAASLLLVGVIGYELGVTSTRSKVESEKLKVNTGNESVNEKESRDGKGKENREDRVIVAEGESGLSENTDDKLNPVAESERVNRSAGESEIENKIAANKQSRRKANEEMPQNSDAGGNTTNNLQASNRSTKKASSVYSAISNSDEVSGIEDKNAKRERRKQSVLQKSKAGGVNTTVQEFEKSVANDDEDVTFASAASSKNALEESLELNRMEGLLESSATDDETGFKKTDEDALPKRKKKIFNYSLGVLANVTGTTVGSQSDNRAERPPLFYNKPSYAAGFTHEFLFLNRIAISNSILYSQTGFKVYHPTAPVDSSSTTKNYSSAIRELQIPIGIKAYPVVKKYFRFSIAAGIINHIKLKEVFTVEKETQPVVIPNTVVQENSFVSNADNPFTGSNTKSMSLQDASSTRGEQAEYFGMGGLKRYYASFYASAGLEFIAKKHFIFFTEPMFYMSLNKIGLQDKRKYNVGVNGGFRYQF